MFILHLLQSLTAFGQETSQGVLSSAIAEVNEELLDLSNQTYASLSSLNDKLESEREFMSDTSELLIKERIDALKSQLNTTQSSLDSLNDEYNEALLDCEQYLNCDSCTGADSCVWCTVEKVCVEGDTYGPTGGNCTDYMYEECSYPGCEGYTTCDLCISDSDCGWCSIGHVCYEATYILKGDCKFEYFYHIEGNYDCPDYTPSNSTNPSPKSLQLKKQIDQLNDQKNNILQDISNLEQAQSNIVKESRVKKPIPDLPSFSDLGNIVDVTDYLANYETSSNRDFQNQLIDYWGEFTSSEINSYESKQYYNTYSQMVKYDEDIDRN
jgi:Plexin repeat